MEGKLLVNSLISFLIGLINKFQRKVNLACLKIEEKKINAIGKINQFKDKIEIEGSNIEKRFIIIICMFLIKKIAYNLI